MGYFVDCIKCCKQLEITKKELRILGADGWYCATCAPDDTDVLPEMTQQ